MKVEVKKLYKDRVDVRDYMVKRCIENKQPLEIIHGVDKMVLSPEELEHDLMSVSKIFESKLEGGRSYRLVSYMWNPIKSDL